MCHWCQNPGHIKKDCKDFAKWKSDKDSQREKDGRPPFKPQDRKNNKGVDSLEAEEDDNYVALGTGEEEDSDDNGVDALDTISERDDDDKVQPYLVMKAAFNIGEKMV